MLPEMRYVENELLPRLRERAGRFEKNAQKQLKQWRGEPGVCSLLLHVKEVPEVKQLPSYNFYEIHYDPEKCLSMSSKTLCQRPLQMVMRCLPFVPMWGAEDYVPYTEV